MTPTQYRAAFARCINCAEKDMGLRAIRDMLALQGRNPEREADWGYIASIGLVRELMQDRMYPLTVGGLERAVQALRR